MGRLLGTLVCAVALLFLTACETVNVSTSAADSKSLAQLDKYYLDADFPETDGFKDPRAGLNRNTLQAIKATFASKGYTEVGSASEADFVVKGSWERGKIINSKSPNAEDLQNATKQHSHMGYYLTLSAIHNGDSLWSANSPIPGNAVDASIETMLTTFPASDS